LPADWMGVLQVMKIGFIVIILSILVSCASVGLAQGQISGQESTSRADSLYGDLSQKEDCILNYERACSERNIDRYAGLFNVHCEFISMMGKPDFDADIFSGQMLRKADLQGDLESTRRFFAAVAGLRFEIEAGTWMRLDSLSGDPCPDCWKTTRAYSLSATFGEGGESSVMKAQGHMEFIISPVEGKWKILRIIDQPMDKEGDK
jgi:hypothetical protein